MNSQDPRPRNTATYERLDGRTVGEGAPVVLKP
jgi:hypothetical protein